MQKMEQEVGHLRQLRDYLDLPFNALKGDQLDFLIGDGRRASAFDAGAGYLGLVCEIARFDALGHRDWRQLLHRLADRHDHGFPSSLVAIDDMVAARWEGAASMDADTWLRRAESALALALALQQDLGGRAGLLK